MPTGRLYWLANESFDPVRITAHGANGEIYLLDINASTESGEPNPITIQKVEEPDLDQIEKSIQENTPKAGYDYIDLARFAAQHMYGPQRLIKPLAGVQRIDVGDDSIELFHGSELHARPLAQWHSRRPELYVTVVELQNRTNRVVEIDPRNIRGKWLFAASHNNTIDASGYLGDFTHIYLVSEFPFDTAARGIRFNYPSAPQFLPTGTK